MLQFVFMYKIKYRTKIIHEKFIQSRINDNNFSDVYKAKNMVDNFEEIIANVFLPIIETSINPSSHPNIHKFLNMVSIKLIK